MSSNQCATQSKPEKENGLRPRLRFPEFQDAPAWDEKKLGEISTLIDKRVGERKYTLMSVTAGVGLVSQLEKFGREIAGNAYRNYYVIKNGDFAYNKSATKQYPEGFIAMLESESSGAVPNSIFICFRINDENTDRQFLKQFFYANFHGAWLRKFISIGARAHGSLNVDPAVLLRMPINMPSYKEQQKIADCLTSLDDLIAAQSQKLAALKAHKKGLLQALFPTAGETLPRLRFPEFQDAPAWGRNKIDDVCVTFSGGTPNTAYKEFYGGDIPFIRSAEIDKDKTELFLTDQGLVNSSAKLIKKGDVLIALYGANSGEVALAKLNGAINQAILCLKSTESNNFIYHYLSFKKDWIVSTYIQGGQGNLSGEIIKSLELGFPKIKEQQKIADCLTALDDLIAAQSQKLAALKTHKKGLLQQLFPAPDAAGR